MKDRDGNEWVLVPVKATDAMVRAAMSAVNGALLYRWAQSVTDAIIAAAPQFVAGEVTDEICERVFDRAYDLQSECGEDTSAHEESNAWLAAWRSELGPALGLETQRHRDNEIDALKEKLARSDARIAELERDNERIDAQWRDELRIYREAENSRIAELEQSVTVRDTEIARLETDLELGRHTLMLESERMQGEINRAAKTHESEMELLAESGEVVADAARYLAIDPRGQEAELARLTALVEAIARAGNGGGV